MFRFPNKRKISLGPGPKSLPRIRRADRAPTVVAAHRVFGSQPGHCRAGGSACCRAVGALHHAAADQPRVDDAARFAHRKGNDPAEEPSRSRGMGAWLQLCSPRTKLRAWHPLPSRCCNADWLVLECDEGAPSPGGGEQVRVWQRFRPLLRPKARRRT